MSSPCTIPDMDNLQIEQAARRLCAIRRENPDQPVPVNDGRPTLQMPDGRPAPARTVPLWQIAAMVVVRHLQIVEALSWEPAETP